jgi:hypothetical protein
MKDLERLSHSAIALMQRGFAVTSASTTRTEYSPGEAASRKERLSETTYRVNVVTEPSSPRITPLETAMCFYPRSQDFLTNLRPHLNAA